MNRTLVVYLDIDGVLADLESRYFHLTGKNVKDTNSEEFWNVVSATPKFFRNLQIKSGAKEIFSYLEKNFENLNILSSCGLDLKKEQKNQEYHIQKLEWIREHISRTIPVITTAKGAYKRLYASPQALLIDDYARNIELFKAANGHGIVYHDAKQTIKEIEELMIALVCPSASNRLEG